MIKRSSQAPQTETKICQINPLPPIPIKSATQPPKNPPTMPTTIFPKTPKPEPRNSRPANHPDMAPIKMNITKFNRSFLTA